MALLKKSWRRWIRWLPFWVMVCTAALWLSPLGIIAALVAGILTELVLERLGWIQPGNPIDPWLPPRVRSGDETIDVDRTLSMGEIAMGGPVYYEWLLRDGAIVGGIDSGWTDVAGGRFRLATADPRDNQQWVAWDTEAHDLYIFNERSDYDSLMRASRQVDVSKMLAMCSRAERVPYHLIRGVWVSTRYVPEAPAERLHCTLPSGRTLEARILLPNDLRATFEPSRIVYTPPYELYHDAQATGLGVLSLKEVHESPRGQCLVLRGATVEPNLTVSEGLWHIRSGDEWHSIQGLVYRPSTGPGSYSPYFLEPVSVSDEGAVEFEAYHETHGHEGITRTAPPDLVELRVSWQATPLLLATSQARLVVQVPREH